ncbi:MAG: hypothetical protein LBG79_04330, partial [Spirochaetaceae bacterium]|nr:hypothetical protein [Spirochaetaceae bacterium]
MFPSIREAAKARHLVCEAGTAARRFMQTPPLLALVFSISISILNNYVDIFKYLLACLKAKT